MYKVRTTILKQPEPSLMYQMRKVVNEPDAKVLTDARQRTINYIIAGTQHVNPKKVTFYNKEYKGTDLPPAGSELRDTLTELLLCFTPALESQINTRKILLRQCLCLMEIGYYEYLGEGYYYIPYYRTFIRYNTSFLQDRPLRAIHGSMVFYHGDSLASFLQDTFLANYKLAVLGETQTSALAFVMQWACEISRRGLSALLSMYLPLEMAGIIWDYFKGTF